VSHDKEKDKWFVQTVHQFEVRLVRYANRFVALHEARDVVQECFLKAWTERFPNLVGREAAWLFTVTRNLCLDAKKRDRRRDSELNVHEEIEAQQESSLEKMEKQEAENQILQKLKKLSDSQQEVMRLKFQEGFSYKQISEITGHSVSYVGVLIHEGMTILRGEIHGGRQ